MKIDTGNPIKEWLRKERNLAAQPPVAEETPWRVIDYIIENAPWHLLQNQNLKWIDVKDKLPECSEEESVHEIPVIAYISHIDGSCTYLVCFYGKGGTHQKAFRVFGCEIKNVTHWIHLPEKP